MFPYYFLAYRVQNLLPVMFKLSSQGPKGWRKLWWFFSDEFKNAGLIPAVVECVRLAGVTAEK